MARHVVANASEIASGERKLVQVNGREVAIFNIGGEYFAIHNRCPHEGASLCRGILVGLVESSEPGEYRFTRAGELLRCPWHGWEFDIRTGKSWFDPKRTKVRAFEVALVDGSELVQGPYEVETFVITADQDYLVIEA